MALILSLNTIVIVMAERVALNSNLRKKFSTVVNLWNFDYIICFVWFGRNCWLLLLHFEGLRCQYWWQQKCTVTTKPTNATNMPPQNGWRCHALVALLLCILTFGLSLYAKHSLRHTFSLIWINRNSIKGFGIQNYARTNTYKHSHTVRIHAYTQRLLHERVCVCMLCAL